MAEGGGTQRISATALLTIYVLADSEWVEIDSFTEYIDSDTYVSIEREIIIPGDVDPDTYDTDKHLFSATISGVVGDVFDLQWFSTDSTPDGDPWGIKWYDSSAVETPKSMLPNAGNYFTFFMVNKGDITN